MQTKNPNLQNALPERQNVQAQPTAPQADLTQNAEADRGSSGEAICSAVFWKRIFPKDSGNDFIAPLWVLFVIVVIGLVLGSIGVLSRCSFSTESSGKGTKAETGTPQIPLPVPHETKNGIYHTKFAPFP